MLDKNGGAEKAFQLLSDRLSVPPYMSPQHGPLVDVMTEAAEDPEAIIILPRFSLAVLDDGNDLWPLIVDILQAKGLVIDSRPEFWMFALSNPPWADDPERTWGISATGCRATIRMRMRDNQDENPVWGERRRA